MKIYNKGVIDTYEDINREVPKDAIKYIDYEVIEKNGRGTAFYCIFMMLVPIMIFSVKYASLKETPMVFSILGIVIGCVLLLPHELLHGICFPKGSNVELYQMIKPPKMFVASNAQISRYRFIFINLMPSIVFGLIPLLIWMYISPYTYIARTLFSIGFISMITAGKDYMNIIRTIRRVPPFCKIQTSGVKVYYFPLLS